MISICIPIYNFDVRLLVETLADQSEKVGMPCELVLIDDCSSDDFREINREVCEKHTYILLPENIGRSKIRNLFLKHAKYDHLLFLDCDSMVENPDFLANYMESAKTENLVVCGGRVYPPICPDDNHYLRWNFGMKRESQSAETRRLKPNKSFMTNNFLIHRSLFQDFSFDESLMGYGHEDTLFGFQLKKNGVQITHIENPVLNGDIETNKLFVEKTERGVENLSKIVRKLDFESDFVNDIALLKAFVILKKYHLQPLFNLFFALIKPILKSLLITSKVPLKIFDIYKLGLLSMFMD